MIARVPLAVDTRAPHGETNAFLAGDPAVLVDPATRAPALDSAVSERDVAHVAVTHTHPDHVGAVAHYASETDATVWCRAGRERAFESATGLEPDRTYVDGTPLEDTGVVAMETPGHAPEHTAFVLEDDAVVGDLLAADGSVFVGTPDGDMRAYFVSLRRLLTGGFEHMYPAHGPPVTPSEPRVRAVIAHRQERERRIEVAVVESGARTVDEILALAYEKDLTGLEDLAARTVRAHLEKLAVEDRVSWDGSRAEPREAAPGVSRNG